MTKDERREQMEPERLEAIRSRLVQIKIAITARRVRELEERVNVIERAYLDGAASLQQKQTPKEQA